MTSNQNHPREFDAILGGDAPPLLGAVLGGVEGVKQRLASSDIETRIGALSRALNYGDAGFNLVIKALEDNSAKVRKTAARLLKNIDNIQVKVALNKYKFWTTFEKYYDIPDNHATTFANRKVIEFDSVTSISDTVNTAYTLRVFPGKYYYKQSEINTIYEMQMLLQSSFASNLEALIFGFQDTKSLIYYTFLPVVDVLLKVHENLTNVKALFLGDVNNFEFQDISIVCCNLSYLLLAYPQLEILKVRNSCCRYGCLNYAKGLEFSPIRHENLKTLIIEGINIAYDVFEDICKLELPALEYLELWMGENPYPYISEYDISKFISIFYNIFPQLKYLGLRKYSHDNLDNIAFAIANSPICENLVELDLSMGKIGDKGARALLDCPALRQLDTLNISYNYLTDEMVQEMKKLDIEVISEKQNSYRDYSSYE